MERLPLDVRGALKHQKYLFLAHAGPYAGVGSKDGSAWRTTRQRL